MTFLLVLAGLVFCGCEKQEPETAKPAPGSENPLDAPGRYGAALVQGQKQAVKTADLAGVKQAIQMFHVQEGRFPKDLNELVSDEYLPKLPDPPNGMKYDYDPKTGEVAIVAK